MRFHDLIASSSRWFVQFKNSRSALLKGVGRIGLGIACLHFAVVRPLSERTDRLGTEVAAVSQRMDGLASARIGVENANDLLAALAAQESSLQQARQSLAELRTLRAAIDEEARLTATAQSKLNQLLELQSRLNDATGEIEAAHRSVDSLAAMIGRAEALGTQSAARSADMQRALDTVQRFGDLKDQLLTHADTLGPAVEQWEQARKLHASLVSSEADSRLASERSQKLIELSQAIGTVSEESLQSAAVTADGLLAIQETLALEDAARTAQAERTLTQLLAIQSELSGRTDDVVVAIENLDLLNEFQQELSRELAGLEPMREQLTRLTLLKETIARVAAMVSPLAELSSLRRLDDKEVRAMAREILEQRTARAEKEQDSPASRSAGLFDGTVERPVPEPRVE